MLPTVAPGQTPGVLRIASSVLHILSQAVVAPVLGASETLVKGRKAAQERFSEENFWRAISTRQKSVSQTLPRHRRLSRGSRHTTSLD